MYTYIDVGNIKIIGIYVEKIFRANQRTSIGFVTRVFAILELAVKLSVAIQSSFMPVTIVRRTMLKLVIFIRISTVA